MSDRGIPAAVACKEVERGVRYMGRILASPWGGHDGDDFASTGSDDCDGWRCSPGPSRLTPVAPGFSAMFAGSRNVPTAEGPSRRGDNPVIQLVGFRLDNEDYAIAITKIQEIILMKPITRIPQVPDFIEGLINLRGSVIPIVNLRKRFGLAAREVDDETRTIVVNVHDKTVGCIVDAVTQVMRINRDQIQPPPLSVLAVAHQYISGLARLEDRLLIILDIERLFDEQSLAAVPVGQARPSLRATPETDRHRTETSHPTAERGSDQPWESKPGRRVAGRTARGPTVMGRAQGDGVSGAPRPARPRAASKTKAAMSMAWPTAAGRAADARPGGAGDRRGGEQAPGGGQRQHPGDDRHDRRDHPGRDDRGDRPRHAGHDPQGVRLGLCVVLVGRPGGERAGLLAGVGPGGRRVPAADAHGAVPRRRGPQRPVLAAPRPVPRRRPRRAARLLPGPAGPSGRDPDGGRPARDARRPGRRHARLLLDPGRGDLPGAARPPCGSSAAWPRTSSPSWPARASWSGSSR